MLTNPPVLYESGVLNVKAVVTAFNQEKALVGAFSVIVQLHRLIGNSSADECCVVVLRSPRALSVISALYERPLHRTVHCGDHFKVACLWIPGKLTYCISPTQHHAHIAFTVQYNVHIYLFFIIPIFMSITIF